MRITWALMTQVIRTSGRHRQGCCDEMERFNASIAMKHRVTCMVGGKVFYVECFARNHEEARRVALAQHPNARIMGVNVVFT